MDNSALAFGVVRFARLFIALLPSGFTWWRLPGVKKSSKQEGEMKLNVRINGVMRTCLSTFAVCLLPLGTAFAADWSLEEAAAPYRGATIRTIGEALPPLEACGDDAWELVA